MEWPLLAGLEPSERHELLASTVVRTFGRGAVVVHHEDPADGLHLVESGRFAVRVTTEAGDSAILNVLGPGDYFGELALLEQAEVRTASVVALEPACTRSLTVRSFTALRARHPAVDQVLLSLLARRVEELSTRLVETMYDGMDRRVSRRLAELVRAYATGPDGPVVIPLTQDSLAEVVGGTRPSVNQALQRLAARGVVELGRGRLTVLDRSALATWAPGGGPVRRSAGG